MNSKNDALGQEILAYLNGAKSYEIIERDDGFIDFSLGARAYFADFKDWPKDQKQAMKLVKGKVLDVGAGAGRVSLYLQRKGFQVTAIDKSPIAIRVCKKRGVKDARVLPIEKIHELQADTFNTVIMYGNNFGLFGSRRKAKALLNKLYRITRPDALILAESVNVYDTKDPVHLAYHKLNRKRGRMAGQLRIRIRFRNYIGEWFDYLLVSKKEMQDILAGTGWRIKQFIKSDGFFYCAAISKNKSGI